MCLVFAYDVCGFTTKVSFIFELVLEWAQKFRTSNLPNLRKIELRTFRTSRITVFETKLWSLNPWTSPKAKLELRTIRYFFLHFFTNTELRSSNFSNMSKLNRTLQKYWTGFVPTLPLMHVVQVLSSWENRTYANFVHLFSRILRGSISRAWEVKNFLEFFFIEINFRMGQIGMLCDCRRHMIWVIFSDQDMYIYLPINSKL